MKPLILGEADANTRKYLISGAILLAVIAILGLGFQLVLDNVVAGWPIRTGFETITIGTFSLAVSTLTSIWYIGLLLFGILLAFVPAYRNNGLLASLLLGSTPIVGNGVGVFFYYGNFTQFGYLTGVPLGHYLLVGTTLGIIGFTLGRISR